MPCPAVWGHGRPGYERARDEEPPWFPQRYFPLVASAVGFLAASALVRLVALPALNSFGVRNVDMRMETLCILPYRKPALPSWLAAIAVRLALLQALSFFGLCVI